MLRMRLLLAAAILVPLLSLVYADFAWNAGVPGSWLLPLAVAVAGLAAAELHGLYASTVHDLPRWALVVGVSFVVVAAGVPVVWPWLGFVPARGCPLDAPGWAALAAVATLYGAWVHEMRRFAGERGRAAGRLGFLALALIYLGLGSAFLVALRLFRGNGWGMSALLTMIVIVKVSDSGAYAFGRALGRHPLAPRLSPKKTLEGLLGGFLAAIAASLWCRAFLLPSLLTSAEMPQAGSWVRWVGYGIALAAAGVFGDLSESLLKRDSGAKDSSHWLPGLGGALDVIDSVLLSGPVAYVVWLVGLVGPGTTGLPPHGS